MDSEALADGLRLSEGTATDSLAEGLIDSLSEADGEILSLGDIDSLADVDGLIDLLSLAEGESEAEPDPDGLILKLIEPEGLML